MTKQIECVKDLRDYILQHVKPMKGTSSDPFGFSLDLAKVQESLTEDKTNAHIFSLSKTGVHISSLSRDTVVHSYYPTEDDLNYLTEFLNDGPEIYNILNYNGGQLMYLYVFITRNSKGVKLPNGKFFTNEKIFNILNGLEDEVDSEGTITKDLLPYAVGSCPCFRILVNKRYSSKRDNIIYATRTRYNKSAIKYLENMKK